MSTVHPCARLTLLCFRAQVRLLDDALQRGGAPASALRKASTTPFLTPLSSPAAFGAAATPGFGGPSRFEFMQPGAALSRVWNASALPATSLLEL